MINIPHIDLKIWNPEHKVIEIIHSLQTTGKAVINMDSEGSDCEALGLYRILDSICDKFAIDPKSITVLTKNQLEKHSRYNIKRSEPLYIDSGQQFVQQHTVPRKDLDKLKHFGIFISRSSWQRLWLASHVWNNYKHITEMTYHYVPGDDYHRQHLGLDELVYQVGSAQTVDSVMNFLSALPITNDQIDSYPILTPAHFAISKLYSNFFVEIVCETFLAGNSFYPTEKTWRPLLCRTPFILLGPKKFLANLRKLGFRTFGQWWDESYDQDADLDNGRIAIQSIQKTLKDLASRSREELEGLLIDMQPTLEHNYQRFMSLTKTEFGKIWP